mmetsp:Transcript_1228/g.2487  ORF Transcript_1228/g.2487 Transcript_1228/m.2487 type:complete len:162 (+) Transcript_1228:579-1064(+)
MESVTEALSASIREHNDRHALFLVTETNLQYMLRQIMNRNDNTKDNDGEKIPKNIIQQIEEALEEMRRAISAYTTAVEEETEWKRKCAELRKRALSGDEGKGPMGEMELDELDRLWEQPCWEGRYEGGDETSKMENQGTSSEYVEEESQACDPAMDLFYGR